MKIPHTKDQASPELCDPYLYGPYDLNDDFVICSECTQGWVRDTSNDTWGPFTIKQEYTRDNKGWPRFVTNHENI